MSPKKPIPSDDDLEKAREEGLWAPANEDYHEKNDRPPLNEDEQK